MGGIDHDRVPSLQGSGFRAHCRDLARRELPGVRLSVEVVRMQVRRARDIGRSDRTCAGVRATAGRDPAAFFCCQDGIGVFRTLRQPVPDVLARIAASAARPYPGCASGVAPDEAGRRIGALSARALARFGTGRPAMRNKTWLRAQKPPADTVLMIGETGHQREMMTAGGLAGFVTGRQFFAGAADAV